MKLIKKYLPGDKVFAKVRGYPPWPARVEGVTDPNTKNAKYKVFFYGTGETAVCKVEELFLYEDNKEKYGKHLKRKIFHEGLQQLEQELNNDQGKTQPVTQEKETVVAEKQEEKRPKADAPPPPLGLDSDLETGPLVIDEGDKKKQIKRKSLATPINSQDSPEPKKKRGRGKGWYIAESTPKPESNDSQGEDALGKEVVSRSGRKIKRKRFADFSSSDEFDMENFGRNKSRSKVDDSIETPATPSTVVTKKRTSIESNYYFSSEGMKRCDKSSGDKNSGDKISGDKIPVDKKEEKKVPPKEEPVSPQKSKLSRLRMENQLLQLDAQIKSNLGLDKANADKCLEAMDEMLGFAIDSLMLKKHPHIVETVKRLRRYIGNMAEWNLTEDQVMAFKQKAEQIRQKAEHIYNKFKTLFTIPDGQSFWQSFSEQIDQFKEVTKDMTEEKIFALMVDPTISEKPAGTETASLNETTPRDDASTMEIDEETTAVQTPTNTSSK